MSSGTGTASAAKPGPPSKPGQGTFSTVAPSSHAILLDKLNRRSTPDSEALASSDDETDSHRQEPPQPVAQPQKPVRRASWLNDTTQPLPRPRKGSFASSSMSPTTSHPSTPSAEGNAPWGTHSQSSGVIGRAPGAGSAFSWGTAIWNSERKDPPSRLSEVLPSPTSTMPPGSAGGSFFNDNNYGQTSPAPRDAGTNAQIPFAIPLHPTPKTYRSQSYSVGQLEPDAPPASMSSAALLGRSGRAHGHGHSGLQHRPSRPSMLSEMSNDSGFLGKVKEVDDDDDESATESMQGSIHQTSDAKTIEMLARENAMLRQQQQQQQQQQQYHQHQSLASHFHLLHLVEKLADAIENGTRDQQSDALVNDLNNHFEKCRQLLNSISGSLSSKAMTVEGQKKKLEEHEQLLSHRRELIGKYKNSVEELVKGEP